MTNCVLGERGVVGGAWEVVNCYTRESHGPLYHSRMTEHRYGRCVFSEH